MTHQLSPWHGSWQFPAFSARRRRVVEQASKLAGRHDPLLLVGPTGAGKSTLARDIANHSPWWQNVEMIDCSQRDGQHLDRELFGVEGKSFTEVSASAGALALSQNGTLIAEEIGDIKPPDQTLLLTLTERWVYKPLGGSKEVAWTGRLIMNTCRDLQAMVARGDFREDLYYRISQNTIVVPPLEEEEIRELIETLLVHGASRLPVGSVLVASERRKIVDHLMGLHLPGGTRQVSKFVNAYLSHKETRDHIDMDALEVAMSQLQGDLRMYTPDAKKQRRSSVQVEVGPPSPTACYPHNLGDLIVLRLFLRDAEIITSLDALAFRYGITPNGAQQRLQKAGLRREHLGNVEALRAARERILLPPGIHETLREVLD